MSIVAWSDTFKTGNDEIDKEHWGLFALIHDLDRKLTQKETVTSVISTFKALVAYVDIHFQHEERIMEEAGYPELDAHKRIHKALGRRVGEFRADFLKNPKTFDYDELMAFLSNWLRQHILQVDMAFAATLKNHQDQP